MYIFVLINVSDQEHEFVLLNFDSIGNPCLIALI